MALILNIETTTNICSVCLAKDGSVAAMKETGEGKAHSSLLAVYIDELLAGEKMSAASLDAVAVSKGPGSYTGLRIGVSTAKGLCYGVNAKLLGIDTLQSMAVRAIREYKNIHEHKNVLLCPMIDARRMEVYTAFYKATAEPYTEVKAEIITKTSFHKQLQKQKVFFFGNGAEKCKKIIEHPNAVFIDGIFPCAGFLAPLSEQKFKSQQFEDIAYFEPFYLKEFITTTPKKNVF